MSNSKKAHENYRMSHREKVRLWSRNAYHRNREKYLAYGKARSKSLPGIFSRYKVGARVRGIEFHLSLEQFKSFWGKDCTYCGQSIPTIGIDRVDSQKGYQIDNINPCCSICNKMKLNLPREIFLEHVHKIVLHSGQVLL